MAENLPKTSGRGTQINVELRLLHSSRDLCQPVRSSRTPAQADHSLSWNETLQFNIEIRDIPKVLNTTESFHKDL